MLIFLVLCSTIRLPNKLYNPHRKCVFLFLIKMHALFCILLMLEEDLFGDNRAAFFVRQLRLAHFLFFIVSFAKITRTVNE